MVEPPSKRMKIEESFVLSEQQQQLIREDTANKKLWDEALDSLKEGPVGVTHCTPAHFRVQMFVSMCSAVPSSDSARRGPECLSLSQHDNFLIELTHKRRSGSQNGAVTSKSSRSRWARRRSCSSGRGSLTSINMIE